MQAPSDSALPALPSLFDLVQSGGPLMWPLLVCSLSALAFTIERALALRRRRLGTVELGARVVDAARAGGFGAARAVLGAETSALARILSAGLAEEGLPAAVREKRVEETANREVRRLAWNLKPLHVVYLVAPLIGLLGTVWGLITCFATIATREGLGRADLLATGVYQALVTTAAGLVIAIPTLVVYTHFRNRLERFARTTEDAWRDLDTALARPALPGAAA